MSLDLINHKLTTSTTDENGVITWNNPTVNVSIDSNGKVFKKGKIYKGYFDSCNQQGKYHITLSDGTYSSYNYISFNSLFSRIVLGVKLGGKTLYLKDANRGYTTDNVSVGGAGAVPKTQTTSKSETTQPLEKKATPKQLTLTTDTPEIEMKPNSNKQYYTVYEAKNEHTTEDGAVFPTKELAEWHQTKVTKGKGNAQVVLDYNGGYVLAEQIYLQEVVYNKAKPYTNFIDVLNNNQGIVSVVQEEHCKFDQLDKHSGLSPVQLKLFGLDKVINLPCTKLQAEKINTSLNKYSEAFSKLEDEHKTLKDLLNQVS